MLRALTLLLLLSLGCHNSIPKANSRDALHVVVSSSPESLDPRFASSAVAANISELLYASLFRIGDDLLPEPLLAEEITQINPLTFSIHLRSDIYFHDGSPITANDVVHTFTTLGNTDVLSPHAEKFAYLKEVIATSEHDVKFTLREPYAPIFVDLCGMGIMSAKNPTTGSGPFVLESFNRVTDTILLKPHLLWFEGAPPLKHIEIRVVKDGTTRILELIKGKADFTSGELSPIQVRIIEKYPEKLTIRRSPGLGYGYIAFNLRDNRPTADLHVRQALAMALDIDGVLKAKFHGMATRASGMIPPYHWAKSKNLELFKYDPRGAERLLDAAGYPRKKNGTRFTITLTTTPDRFRQSLSLVYAAQWRAIGVDAQVRIQDWGSLYQDMKQGNFEAFSAVWIPVIEPNLLTWIFHSDKIPDLNKGGGNRGAYIDKIIDEMLMHARGEIDFDKRRILYERIENRLLETLPYIPLWFMDEIVVMNRRVIDFIPSRTGSLFGLRHTRLQP